MSDIPNLAVVRQVVRQAIFHVLDEGRGFVKVGDKSVALEWRFYDLNDDIATQDIVDFADKVAAFIPYNDQMEELWKAIKEMEPSLGDANKSLAIAASYALLKQRLDGRNAAKNNPTNESHE